MLNLAIVSVFFILIDLGLLMVIMGQYKEMDAITKKNEELKTAKRVFYDNLQYEINFKKSLQDIKTNGEQKLKDMEANQPKLTKQLEDKKSEAAACQEQTVKCFKIHFFLLCLFFCFQKMQKRFFQTHLG